MLKSGPTRVLIPERSASVPSTFLFPLAWHHKRPWRRLAVCRDSSFIVRNLLWNLSQQLKDTSKCFPNKNPSVSQRKKRCNFPLVNATCACYLKELVQVEMNDCPRVTIWQYVLAAYMCGRGNGDRYCKWAEQFLCLISSWIFERRGCDLESSFMALLFYFLCSIPLIQRGSIIYLLQSRHISRHCDHRVQYDTFLCFKEHSSLCYSPNYHTTLLDKGGQVSLLIQSEGEEIKTAQHVPTATL